MIKCKKKTQLKEGQNKNIFVQTLHKKILKTIVHYTKSLFLHLHYKIKLK